MSRMLLGGMLWLGLGACSSAAAQEPDRRDADRWPLVDRALDRTLVAGTLIQATIHSSLLRRGTPGAPLTAAVSADVTTAHRWVVVPAGCVAGLRIARPGADDAARCHLRAGRGGRYPLSAPIEVVPVAGARGTRILGVLPEGFTAARRPGATP
jgi:hypothetical protein